MTAKKPSRPSGAQTNHNAVTTTVKALNDAGRLAPEHQALVTLCLKLAKSVDSYPDNASLWREYRAAVTELVRVGADDAGDADEADEFAAAMRAAMGHSSVS